MMVMNSFHMKEHLTFFRFASNLDLTKHSKASYEPRVQFAQVMAVHRMVAIANMDGHANAEFSIRFRHRN